MDITKIYIISNAQIFKSRYRTFSNFYDLLITLSTCYEELH
jgi:hypothetical protein